VSKYLGDDYLDKRTTTSVNGLFILIVFLNHVQSYIVLPSFFHKFTLAFGQLMVAMFLFYSGYGVGVSVQKKGMDYVREIPKRRVGKVLTQFVPAVLLFAVVDLFCGIAFTPREFLLSLVAWEDIGNSNWYVFVILCLYLITWFSFQVSFRLMKHSGAKEAAALLLMAVLTGILFLVLYWRKESWWYNTLTAYLFGMVVAYRREWLDDMLEKTGCWCLITVLSLAVTIVLKPVSRHPLQHLVMTVSYCLLLLCITKKVPAFHPVLHWLGTHLFEIYILMRIPMILMKESALMLFMNPAVFVLTSFVITLVLAYLYHLLFSALAAFRFAR
jgi:membrane-bound acyltransferase YfiQ involved in biofilm formation